MAVNYHLATGRRKTSTARVFLKEGSGVVTINDKDGKAFFGKEALLNEALEPLVSTELKDKFDLKVSVTGGGVTGQIGAIRLGVARAILKYDASVKPSLKKDGLLTRDSRMVERKKAGRPKARKRFQFSKR
ncbi:MAG: 30S ribosomal protein S9 [Chlorobi bacterium]|nr:30S ribosomal protein S9 [Chlorobiota bacterium]MCI0716722.1 30S ribosomal protein S9 [Chlorobiota bacterium]